jgi:hypothetical protein
VPKGRGPGGAKGSKAAISARGKSSRKEAMPSGTSRARYDSVMTSPMTKLIRQSP